MTKKLFSKIVFSILFSLSVKSYSQYYRLSSDAKISILTCGSGNELYSIYGHTAIRFADSKNGLDVVVNYGNFDFRTSNFYAKFVKGDLQYFAAACSFQDFMQEYIETNREVFEQNLLINEYQKQKLFDEINTSLYTDERYYTYKFIDKNCTTMVLDKVNSVFGKAIVSKKSNTNVSYRTVLYSYLDNHFFENLGINIIFGAKTDGLATKLFLPKELMDNLALTKNNNKPIVENAVILNKKNNNSSDSSWWNNFYFFCVFFLIVIFMKSKKINLVYLSILGLMGTFLFAVGFYSMHHEVTQNYNMLLFNPSLLLLVIFYLKKNKKWILNFVYINLASILAYILLIISKVDYVMMLPFIVTSVFILIQFLLESKKLLPSVK